MDEGAIRQDFAAFADPMAPLVITADAIEWNQGRQQRRALLIDRDSSDPRFEFDGQVYGYREFFASDHMADLSALAEMLTLVLPKQAGYVGQDFVEPQLCLDDSGATAAASSILNQALQFGLNRERTDLLFIKGRAGDGKSALLVHKALQHANAYRSGNEQSLFLYINAQGSALARIDEVMAKTLQDLRASFTYHAIATLTRLGLLVPIIDGFDELLGVGGYKDAFSSLALFIARLNGQGTVIASARSTFYQYTNFGEQAARFATDENPLLFRIVPITLQPWGDREREEFLLRKGITRSRIEVEKDLGTRRGEILSSPFLFNQLVALGPDVLGSSHKHVVRLIVEELIKREMQEKLLDPQGRPLLTLDQHIEILGMLAEEMWWQETREIDESTFTTIAILAAEQFALSGDVARRFLDRVPSYALIARSEGPVRIAFRHEFYFAFFLGMRIAAFVIAKQDATAFMARATLTTVISEEVSQTLSANPPPDLCELVSGFPINIPAASAPDMCRSNLGVLYWSFLRDLSKRMTGAKIKDSVFNGMDFRNSEVSGVSFERCTFNECDLSDAKWLDVSFQDCSLAKPVVSTHTTLKGTGLRLKGEILGVSLVLKGGEQKSYYSLAEVGTIFEQIGMRFADKVPKEREITAKATSLIEELEQFLRVPERTLYFSNDDFAIRGLDLDGGLRSISNLLRKHGLMIEVTQKHRRGKRGMYRLSETPTIIREGQSGLSAIRKIQQFWEEILAA